MNIQSRKSSQEITISKARKSLKKISINRALEKLASKGEIKIPVKAKKIFVGGIPNKASKEELFALMSHYGKIEDLSLPMKPNDENKGYAFVTFEDSYSVFRVFADLSKIVLRAKTVNL